MWGQHGDKFYFGRNGIASFKRYSLEYDDFKVFFERFRKINPQHEITNDYLRKGYELFKEFQSKRNRELTAKIKKDRESLPIFQLKEEIIQKIKENRVVLVAADTGAGKSTQIPQYLLEAGFDHVVCTQPRRIACYSLAKRVSFESLNQYGNEIGFQVRFETNKSTHTRAVFVTEGILLRQYSADPYLKMYNIIIIDEVHERHITGDFLLGILKRLLEYRLDVRIVLMSATIQADLFSEYFNAPVVEVPGRMFPVNVEYHPVDEEDINLTDPRFIEERRLLETRHSIRSRGGKIKSGPYLRILERIDEKFSSEERGDLLIFVSGMNEISILSEELKQYASITRRWIVLALHSSLSVAEQEKVFDVAPNGVRKCIISTNLAETSVTIDGIRFIIDSGKVKEMAYDGQAGLSKLSEFWISKSSSKQRAGRAGRTGPGQCYRFYSKKEYESFNDFPVPEILRMPLDNIILEIANLGLGDPLEFEFIEKPSQINIKNSINKLIDIGALDFEGAVTGMGKALAKLPIEPVLGKMLILGSISHLIGPVLALAAVLSIQSPFTSTSDGLILKNRKELYSSSGDSFTLLNIFITWLETKVENNIYSKKWCRKHGVEEQRMYEAVKLKSQFSRVLKSFNGDLNEEEPVENEITAESIRKLNNVREQRRILKRKKHESGNRKRKYLSVDGDLEFSDEEESIDALEFKIEHDAQDLLWESDISVLSRRDFELLKLIMCSGIYPNIAISDEHNRSRSAAEQVFHTKSKRFVSVLPTSVFSENPELLIGSKDPESGREVATELLMYVQILETKKPYLMNPTRIEALPVALLFANRIDLSPDLRTMVMDEWIEFEFYEPESVCETLIMGVWLRQSWKIIVERTLCKENSGNFKTFANDGLQSLDYIPAAIKKIRSDWVKFNSDSEFCNSIQTDDVMNKLIKLLGYNHSYTVRKLKATTADEKFGHDPFAETSLKVQVTPNINFHLFNYMFDFAHQKYYFLPAAALEKEKVQLAPNLPNSFDDGTRSIYQCPNCNRQLIFTNSDIARHKNQCS